VASTLGYRAQAGAKIIYDALTEAMAPRETGTVSGNVAKTVAAKSTADKSASQNTLTPTDLVPAWRGPPARKDGKHPA